MENFSCGLNYYQLSTLNVSPIKIRQSYDNRSKDASRQLLALYLRSFPNSTMLRVNTLSRCLKEVRFMKPLPFYRFNSSSTTTINYNFFPPSVSVTNIKRATKNIPKKKIGAQKLRRTDDSKFQHESASYILSLLNANRQETPSLKNWKNIYQ